MFEFECSLLKVYNYLLVKKLNFIDKSLIVCFKYKTLYFKMMEGQICEKCKQPMIKISRSFSKRWASELIDDLSSAKGNVEFNIIIGHYQYCIWYCEN